ncbi:DUF4177 domain-containing protein [Clostridium isatidis]|uniref:DUF4177 domain-containing protein n=1 Tax=Clostridium isatidis TaxID=182773 RepID=A0A343J945_9CLOT|nr:DUF4177 domain-containing protein [Clostridium isatidis]ASW42053.1 hypothetical protein BEN51_00565 [Clostridium isatidis]
MFEYKFVEVPLKVGFKVKVGDTFEECKEVINNEVKNGWRLKQILLPQSEKAGVYSPYCYQIIFEKEIK